MKRGFEPYLSFLLLLYYFKSGKIKRPNATKLSILRSGKMFIPVDCDKLCMYIVMTRALTKRNYSEWYAQKHCKERKIHFKNFQVIPRAGGKKREREKKKQDKRQREKTENNVMADLKL